MRKSVLAFTLIFILAGSATLWLVLKNHQNIRPGADRNTAEETSFVEAYLRANISSLSPQQPVLGGTFYITNVTFPAEHTALVDYEDGHIALTAEVRYEVMEDRVVIQSFTVMELFVQIGTLIKNNPGLKPGVWYLNYDLPGAPGRLAELIFPPKNIPTDSQVGSRARIIGATKNGVVTVSRMEIVN